jgi:hypothetical protein
VVACSRCDPRGRLSLRRLAEQYDTDTPLTAALRDISADCLRRQAGSWFDRCDPHFLERAVLDRAMAAARRELAEVAADSQTAIRAKAGAVLSLVRTRPEAVLQPDGNDQLQNATQSYREPLTDSAPDCHPLQLCDILLCATTF